MAGLEPNPSDMANGYESTGSNQTGMRERNERLVLTILRRQGALPKAEIARKTGLSAQTVSVIMRALETDGLLAKGEKLRGKVGQPSVPMALAPDGAYFLGLKVGRRSAELILVNFVGEELAHITQAYAYPTPDMTLGFVQDAIQQVCAVLSPDQQKRIAGMGIAAPFFMWEWAAMIGVPDDRMSAWQSFDLPGEVASMVDFPVYLGNDATSACGAELVFGTTETPPEFLYVYIGYFVGGGVVLNGALYSGRSGNAGAIGPFPVGAAGSGQRQLVDTASLIGLERRLTEAVGNASMMIEQQDHWEIDEAIVESWLAEAVPSLAHMIVGAASFIDFPTVLIDGNMPPDLRALIVERAHSALQELPHSGVTLPQILPGSLGHRARALGAASLPLSKRFMLET